MIISENILITISNNGKYWIEKGYGPLKQRDVISVKVQDLPPNSNKFVDFSCEDCNETNSRQFQLLNKQKTHRCFDCTRKYIGHTMDRTKIDGATRKRTGKNHPRWNPNKPKLLEYSRKVRWISEKTYRANIKTLNPANHIRGRMGIPGAYQLDHIKSVKDCFLEGMTAEQAGALENLQMLTWEHNRQKW